MLSLEFQRSKSTEIFSKACKGKENRNADVKLLKPLNLTEESVKSIMQSTIKKCNQEKL